ncbi:MAG: hypothetical protein ACREXP_04015 [Steroidobacteraceae bacterium]
MIGPLGLGPIVWRAIVFRHYGYHTDGPPFTRAHLAKIESHRCPASREYYARIDSIKLDV